MNWYAIYRYRFPRAKLVGSVGSDSEFEELVSKVVGFIEAPALGFDLPLDIRDTAVQQQVWQALMELPAGETASYTEIAAPKAVRAVAHACYAKSNCRRDPMSQSRAQRRHIFKLSIWGVERKRALLDREGDYL